MADNQYTKFTNSKGDNLIILPDTANANNGDVLTFKTGSGLKWDAAPGGGGGGAEYTAGTDIIINNSVISVNTSACTANSANYAFVEGISSIASGKGSHAEGSATSAIGDGSHAEGQHARAKGKYSHAEGGWTSAFGIVSHAEGQETFAFASNSHAEGSSTTARGDASHAEGTSTLASGDYSHAEGRGTSANAYLSHAGGRYTVANYESETVVGQFNISTYDDSILPSSAKPLFVVGNGTNSSIRSDAFIVTMDGIASATNMYTSGGPVVTDVILTSAANSTTSFVTNGVADLTPLYTYIKSLEDRIATLEAAQGGITVNGIQPTVNGNTITVGE